MAPCRVVLAVVALSSIGQGRVTTHSRKWERETPVPTSPTAAACAGGGWRCWTHIVGPGETMPNRRLVILGERGSGVDFVAALIDANFDNVTVEAPHWKHGCAPLMAGLPPDERAEVPSTAFLALGKHPLPWVVSLWRHHGHALAIASTSSAFQPRGSLEGFARRRVPVREADNVRDCGGTGRSGDARFFASVSTLWNRKHASFLRLASDVPRGLMLRVEDVYRDPAEAMRLISARTGLPRRLSRFVPLGEESAGVFRDRRECYRRNCWREKLNGTADEIMAGIDSRVLSGWGYERLP